MIKKLLMECPLELWRVNGAADVGQEKKMSGVYNFYQKIDARRLGLTSVGVVLLFDVAVCWLVPVHSFPLFPRLLLYGILIGVLAMFAYSWRPYISTGGYWLIFIREGLLHVEFPPCDSDKAYELAIESITEIRETRTRSAHGTSSITSPLLRLCTRERLGGQVLPQVRQFKVSKFLKVVKQMRPDIPHNVTYN